MTTDQPDVQGEALAGLAEVLSAAGKLHDASAALLEAITRFDTKGNTVSAARARQALDRLAAPAATIIPAHSRAAGEEEASA